MRMYYRQAPLRGLVLQYLRFGSVGLSATVVHVVLFALMIEIFELSPMSANAAAFSFAVLVSFSGHWHWTFPAQPGQRTRGSAFGKFVLTAAAGLALNAALVYGVTEILRWHYGYAIALMVTVTPALLFVLGKFWAFAPARQS